MAPRSVADRNSVAPMPDDASPPDSPVWLAHHLPDHYDRCVTVAGRHVCRRCIVLWPVTFAAMTLSIAVGLWPEGLDGLLLFVLPLPAVVDFVAEQRRWADYDPRRQVAVTVPLAIALGRGFDRYLSSPGDLLFWSMVGVYGVIAVAAAISRTLDDAAL